MLVGCLVDLAVLYMITPKKDDLSLRILPRILLTPTHLHQNPKPRPNPQSEEKKTTSSSAASMMMLGLLDL